MLDTFKDFIGDKYAFDMFVTGAAGTGKTTSLKELADFCSFNSIHYQVCAYTHKACGILASKLSSGAPINTLHSFLGKRPCINMHAIKKEHVNINTKAIEASRYPKVLFIDEYSMIGEKDFVDIRDIQDDENSEYPKLKVVWIGDQHQLPPVGDVQAITPEGDYIVNLTKIWRNDNPLQTPLNNLIAYMVGNTMPEPLKAVKDFFIRDTNIVEEYKSHKGDKALLAYTNNRVQSLNAEIAGKAEPEVGDKVFSPTTQKTYTFAGWKENPNYIDLHYADPILKGDKYRPLENLIESQLCKFAILEDEEGNTWQHAVVFGHYDYKIIKEQLTTLAVKANKAIETKHNGHKAAAWSRNNKTTALAKSRGKAWRDCLGFNNCVICIDFAHAMTVHKSQGSTFETVFIDTDDIAICAQKNFDMYLKLLYVAISRASRKVVTT